MHIGKLISAACGLDTEIIHIDDLSRGIGAEYIEVLVTAKAPSKELRFALLK